MIRAKILLLSTFCLFSLCFCTHSVLGKEVTKENGVIPYKDWKDYTKEEKERLKNRWTEDDKYKNIQESIIERKFIPKDALKIKSSDGTIRSDLRGISLQRAGLHRASLWRADLQGANLKGADLRKTDLQGANLGGANLQRADLQRARLVEADLNGANLQGADLQRARLVEADLNGADLLGAKFGSTYLWLANLDEAKNIRYIIWGEKYVINDELINFLKSKFSEDQYTINMPQITSLKEYHSEGDFFNALNYLIHIITTQVPRNKQLILMRERFRKLLENKQSILEITSISPKSERYTIGEENSGDLKNAEITYRDLKSFYKERKMHNIASEFHYRENVVKTKLSPLPIKIFRTVFLNWTYGYGSRPLRLIPFCFGVILVFAFIYLLLTLPRKTDSGIYVVTNDGRKEELLPIRKGKILLDCFYFSLLSFATFGYGALQPKQWLQFFYLEPVEFKPRRWARIFVGFEAAIGIYLLALTALVLFKG